MSEENEARVRGRGLAATPKDLLGYRFLYDEWGSSEYDAASGPPYYLFDGEKQLVADCSAALVDQLDVTSLVDLGCGSGAKIVPLLRAFVAKKGTFRYVPVDQSRAFLDIVTANIRESVPGIVVDGVQASYRDEAALTQRGDGGVLYAMFGSEICCQNADEETSIFKLLRALRHVMGPEDHVAFAIDPFQTPEVHCGSYDGRESHAWFQHVVVGLGKAFRHELLPDDFEYVPRWETGLRQQAPWSAGVVHWLKSKKAFRLTHPDDGTFFDVRENELLFMLQSAKVTPAEFTDLLASCGFQSSCPAFQNDRMCLLTFAAYEGAATTEDLTMMMLPEE